MLTAKTQIYATKLYLKFAQSHFCLSQSVFIFLYLGTRLSAVCMIVYSVNLMRQCYIYLPV